MNIQQKQNAPLILSGRDVTAVLGPTNTGKTHLAIERMVAHETGVIGLPLRLLAREVYQRVCDKVGAQHVALVTGEEKIQPPNARYFVCTVEAMPRQTDAAFVAIDEVQLAGDLERGHIFTDRILHLRGRQETLLLGAATMRGILERLLKGLSVVTRPRMSHLAYSGSKKITRLPPRSAIVAFSADEVYAIAELIRRQRGGAAVVLGALSPRTRNAQVALYQSGDVDYLIATDAIGMGLNLDVDHVAFAQNRKFDGYQYRQLTAAELGQIAGRAGRHMRDGTFGVTGQVDPLDEELVTKLEGHDFEPVRVLQWRTADFDFASVESLQRSIDTTAPVEGLTRAPPAVDQQALEHVLRDDRIRGLADRPARVELLWEACALPDYRKIAPAQHADLIAAIFSDLARRGHVDEDYLAEQVRRADSTQGEIDALSQRIAQIRTWTFVSHRPGWLANQAHWQEKTREIEDRLSDALHERLTKRFVDRRTSVLMKRLRENTMLDAEINPAGQVLVEGHHVGELQGFRFTADQSAGGEDAKAVRTAAQKALAQEFEARADRFAAAANGDLALGSDGVMRWIGAPVATLVASEEPLRPRAVLLADEQLTGPARDKIAARVDRFVTYQVDTQLKPLADLRGAEHLSGIARGIAFRLVENLGILNRRDVAEDVRSLDQDARAALRRLGVRFGAYHIFVPALLKPGPAGMLTLLWALQNDGKDKPGFGDVVHALASGRTSLAFEPSFEKEFYRLAGFRLLGRRAVRIDILERLADLIRPALGWRPGTGARPDGGYDGNAFVVTPAMMSILGATAEDMEEILKGLGYRGEPRPAEEVKAKIATLDAEAAAAASAGQARAEASTAEVTRTPVAEPASDGGEAAETVAGTAASDTDASVVESAPVGAEAPDASAAAVAALDVGTQVNQGTEAEPVANAETDTSPAAATAEAPAAEEAQPEPAVAAAGDGAAVADNVAPATAGEAVPSAAVTNGAASEVGAPVEAAVAEAAVESGVGSDDEVEEAKPIILWRPGQRQRGGRPQQQQRNARPDRTGKHGKPRFKGKGGQAAQGDDADGKPNRQQRGGNRKPSSRPREERPQRIDPDSPFAKLAALRDQLKK